MVVHETAKAVLVMGVSGCGKTTVGRKVADAVGWPFFDADDFHSPENIAKMAGGIPLTDQDRQPWLQTLHDLMTEQLHDNRSFVLACSALKQAYRDILLAGHANVYIVYLRGDFDLIWARMQAREGHYMRAEMLQSQFDALEAPTDALIIEVGLDPDEIVVQIRSGCGVGM